MGFHACHVHVVRLITWLLNGKLTNIARSDNKLFLKSPGHFLRCFRLSIVTGSRIIRGEVNLWAGIVTFAMLLAGGVPSASEILWPPWHLSSSWFGYTVPMFKYTILEYNMPLHRWNYGSTKNNSLRSVFELRWSLHRYIMSMNHWFFVASTNPHLPKSARRLAAWWYQPIVGHDGQWLFVVVNGGSNYHLGHMPELKFNSKPPRSSTQAVRFFTYWLLWWSFHRPISPTSESDWLFIHQRESVFH